MNADDFIRNFSYVANAPKGIERLRKLILHFAVRGQLIARDANSSEASFDFPEYKAHGQAAGMPAGWLQVPFGEIGEWRGGGTPSKSNPGFWKGTIPWVSPKDMKHHCIAETQDWISQDAVTQSSTKLIPAGSILIVIRGMILVHTFPVAYAGRELTINQDMKSVIPIYPEIRDFLLLALNALEPEVLNLVERSSHGTCKLLTKDIQALQIPIPPRAEQRRIVAKVDELMGLCDRLESRLAARAKLLPLLSRANHDRFVREPTEENLKALKKPFRLSGELSSEQIKAGDNRFWFDNTRFTEEFLAKVWDLAIAPIDHTEDKTIDFRGRTEPQDLLYLFLKDKDALTQLKEHIGDSYRFFRYVEGSYIADLLDDIRIFVKHKNSADLISFEQLSEGELQLLTVLGLMRITHQDECLFLLDEPDTHLNPIWKLRYFDEIEKVLKQDDDEIIQGDSQIIITTHDPMMIGSLRKEQVRILRNNSERTTVTTPHEHPQGMGVAGLLKSDMFGLPSTLDRDTLEKLDARNRLLGKKQRGELGPQDLAALESLQSYLEDLGFAHESRDPLYQLFIEKMYAVKKRPLDEIMSKEELATQEKLAEKIVVELVKREKTDELSLLAQELKLQLEDTP